MTALPVVPRSLHYARVQVYRVSGGDRECVPLCRGTRCFHPLCACQHHACVSWSCERPAVDVLGSSLLREVTILYDLARHLGDTPTGKHALYVGNEIVNRFNRFDRRTWMECRDLAAEVLKCRGSSSPLRPTVVCRCVRCTSVGLC
jgi:hypothetical protein